MHRGLPLRLPGAPLNARAAARDRPSLAAWDAVLLLPTIFVAGHAPLYVVLQDPPLWVLTLDAWATLLFVVDLALQFTRPVRIGGRPVTDRRVIARRYLSSWFAVDILSAIPFGLLSLLPGIASSEGRRMLALLGLTRALRLARLAHLQLSWRSQTLVHPALYRLGFFVIWAAMLAHWIACGWIALGGPERSHAGLPAYLRALYWTTTTLTTVGYGDVTPISPGQVVYAMLVMVLGAAMFGYVIGNVANLLANADSLRTQHLARLERATLFLRDRGVPRGLRRRLRDYYDYLWESRMGHDDRLFDDLPAALRIELALELSRPILDRVPFLRGASEPFLRELVRHLRPAVFTPGELVLRRGDLGHRIYFIRRGEVEVLAQDERTRVVTLGDGDYFGELALLTHQPRSASIRALDYCDLYTLDREHFEEVLAQFPEFAAEIRHTAAARGLLPVAAGEA